MNFRNRHVSCVDCHNPHAANASPAVRPNAGGALAGVMGVNASGVLVRSVTREYELCFRCHAETSVKNPTGVLRQWPEANMRLQFAASNPSFHPVEAVGKNGAVPSLIRPWNTASFISCSDCHNSNQGAGVGGSGPNGPHGSLFSPLLEQNLVRQDFQAETPGAYALCYKCHDRNSILADQSFKTLGDRGHRFHIEEVQAACTTCHDPHGVATQPRLINFNTFYVSPCTNNVSVAAKSLRRPLASTALQSSPFKTASKGLLDARPNGTFGIRAAATPTATTRGVLKFESRGTFSGTCTLNCHGADHVGSSYP